MYPEDGYKIGAEELRQQSPLVFSWDAVAGATAYILTIYRETPQGRSRIFRTNPPIEETSYTLENWDLFENAGAYVWQVEALNYNSQGNINQHGQPGENGFSLDVPRPEQVRLNDTGLMYGTE